MISQSPQPFGDEQNDREIEFRDQPQRLACYTKAEKVIPEHIQGKKEREADHEYGVEALRPAARPFRSEEEVDSQYGKRYPDGQLIPGRGNHLQVVRGDT